MHFVRIPRSIFKRLLCFLEYQFAIFIVSVNYVLRSKKCESM